MGKTDDFAGNMMNVGRYFADALNSAIYGGRHVVTEADLYPYSERKANTGRNRNGKAVTESMFRDVIKEVRGNRAAGLLACIAGVENQTELSRIMPARVMRYDGTEYVNQGKKLQKTIKDNFLGMPEDAYLVPVVTVVINFSDRKWDQPKSLHELIYPEYQGTELMNYVSDYRINVLDPYDMEDEEIDRMQSSLREVMYTVKYSSDRRRLIDIVSSSSRFSSLDEETAAFVEYFTKIKLPGNGKEGYNMCRAIEELKDEWYEEGRCRAIQEIKDEIQEMKDDIQEKENEIREKENEIQEMKDEIQEKDNEIAFLKAQLAARNS